MLVCPIENDPNTQGRILGIPFTYTMIPFFSYSIQYTYCLLTVQWDKLPLLVLQRFFLQWRCKM